MSIERTILFKSLVKPYFGQNAGIIVFLYFIMFLVVGEVDGAGPLAYHYSLIQAMMTNYRILFLVFIGWLLYASKCEQFIVRTLRREDYGFMNMVSQMNAKRAYSLLFQVQFILLLPVTFYVLIIICVGLHEHWYLQVLLVVFYILSICLLSARRYLYLLQNPGTDGYTLRWRIPSSFLDRFYWSFFIRYVLKRRKLLLLAIKIYSCGILYMMVVHQIPIEYDIRMIVLFYSFGLLGHGVLIHQFREMEETMLTGYRGLPVPLFRRFTQYLFLYFLLFIPEMTTIGCLTPAFLHYTDAFLFIFFGYSVLLLLNSLLFIRRFKIAEYLKILVGVFFLTYIGVLMGIIPWLAVFYFILSLYLFFSFYYRYER
jgi:hypothetical protein